MDYSAKLLKFLAIIVNLLFGEILIAADTTLIDVINLPYSINTIASDSAGTIWLTGARGLQYYDFEKETFITTDPSDKSFLITEKGRVKKFYPRKGQLGFPWDNNNSWLAQIPPGKIRVTAAIDKFGQYWVSSGNQIYIFSIEERFEQPLLSYSTRGIYLDKDDLYVNTYSGIRKNKTRLFEHPHFGEGEIKKYGESLYFAWGGLLRYQPRTQAVDHIAFELNKNSNHKRSPRPLSAHCLEQIRDTIWVGTSFGLGYLENDSVIMVSNYPDIQDLAYFEDGLLIAGSNLTKPRILPIPHHNLPTPNCKDCRGIYLRQNKQLRKLDLPELNYRHILEAEGNYYFASDSGVVVWNGTNVTNMITEEDGLTNNQTSTMVMDDYGFLWVSTFSGLNRINLSTGKIVHYLKNIEFNHRSVLKNDSLVYMGSVQGLFMFRPKNFLGDDIEPTPPWNAKQYLILFVVVTSFLILLTIYLASLHQRRRLQKKEMQVKKLERNLFLIQVEQLVINTDMTITVSSLAHILDISERSLYRTFEKYDLTPGTYLKELRLKKAEFLIQGFDPQYNSLKEIAQEVGYSESYLKKLLKKEKSNLN